MELQIKSNTLDIEKILEKSLSDVLGDDIDNILMRKVEKVISAVVNEKIDNLAIGEKWLNDQKLAEHFGKEKRQIQYLLRKMELDPVARKYISKEGGRSTKVKVFEAWESWYEDQKYKSKSEPFAWVA
jgi:hypothetical protein|nr:MAG TPA: hypothetical protein [Caudoviricetes sp.]